MIPHRIQIIAKALNQNLHKLQSSQCRLKVSNTEEDAGCVAVQLTLLETAGNSEQKHLEGQDRYPEQLS